MELVNSFKNYFRSFISYLIKSYKVKSNKTELKIGSFYFFGLLSC